MMTFKSIFSAICLTTALALPAAAENITAANPQSLMDFFASENATAKMTEDNVGDPKIDMKYYSTEFSVYFYGCDDGKSCDAIQFFSGYATKGEVAIAKINKWNTEQRFGRA